MTPDENEFHQARFTWQPCKACRAMISIIIMVANKRQKIYSSRYVKKLSMKFMRLHARYRTKIMKEAVPDAIIYVTSISYWRMPRK